MRRTRETQEEEGNEIVLFGQRKPKVLSERENEREMQERERIRMNSVLSGNGRVYKVYHLYNIMGPMLGEKVNLELEDRDRGVYKAEDSRDRQLLLGSNEALRRTDLQWERELTGRQKEVKDWIEKEARFLGEKGMKIEELGSHDLRADGEWRFWDEKRGELRRGKK